MQKQDTIFANPMDSVKDFKFDEAVADVFPDMIQRSVPGYQTIIHTIGELAARYVRSASHVYDLGCSLGAASLSVARSTADTPCDIFAIDSSPAMTERCERMVRSFSLPNPVNVQCQLAQDTKINNASMVIMNFTLQFIEPEHRLALLKQIYDGMNDGGVLVLSEKVSHPTVQGNELLIDLHHQFKRDNGYSELEVSQKRAALENVMLTDSFATHEQRLLDAGFSDVVMWYKCYNFMSLVAIKSSRGNNHE
ncbi:carboxy-S-adenosyl-L-methionine synthase CmoA [Salinimonas iocasae]|uniref:Carboxy-S-adenosyl-L-methionine synthase n=1 Tax=Salinimonas iocasae TaxID=2572577 RepID=A0A5B7YGM2_9ALTE|nr:carboxy-S-adenosyl-L-methionine synthase CmoA [Salinimonas iocasae]QCZ93649.1 carboxy-S-adenosyl-L-methionine synthase CmoA [Salinimonas iocasae]